MKYLAIDTSGNYLAVTAGKDGRTFCSCVPDCAMKHSVTLMGEVEKVLNEAELTLAECDFFAAVVGAGSFTGIRIGISAAKGFALACGKPTLAITSFDALAYNVLDKVFGGEKYAREGDFCVERAASDDVAVLDDTLKRGGIPKILVDGHDVVVRHHNGGSIAALAGIAEEKPAV